MMLGMFGAALFYGDGMITPAISVLSAVEGLEVATPLLRLRGSDHAGRPHRAVPVPALRHRPVSARCSGRSWWSGSPAGAARPRQHHPAPSVLAALNPHLRRALLRRATAGSASSPSARWCWRSPAPRRSTPTWAISVAPDPPRLVLGSCSRRCVLNYFGQGALLLNEPAAVQHPFFPLAPDWALYPMVALATVATVIASQAVISGAFSLTRQAIQLGYCPRLMIEHTSERRSARSTSRGSTGGCTWRSSALVLGFGSSSNLAGAYGIAVTGTMAIDSILIFVVMRSMWRWPAPVCAASPASSSRSTCAFSARTRQDFDGGWFPLVVGILVYIVLSTWKRGREMLFERLRPGAIPLEPFIKSIIEHPPVRVPGTAVFLTATQEGVPHALLHNLNHNKVLHERVVLLTVRAEDIPHVPDSQRVDVHPLGHDFFRSKVHYGFKDEPDLPRALELAKGKGMEFK